MVIDVAKRFVIGDIHGRFEALKEVLTLSKFNYGKDRLIVLGDVVDGGEDTYKVIEELLTINNLIFIIGNHDQFFIDYINHGTAENLWLNQGGCNTLNSYGGRCYPAKNSLYGPAFFDTTQVNIPHAHKLFFKKGAYYHISNNLLFVHGGIDPSTPHIADQKQHCLLWDRELIEYAKSTPVPEYTKVFVGHTTTQEKGELCPIRYNNLWCMDCGAGWNGKLAIMDVDTEKYWLSKKQTPSRDLSINDL